jgi:hypothetical protein
MVNVLGQFEKNWDRNEKNRPCSDVFFWWSLGLNRGVIAKNYLSSWFCFDLLMLLLESRTRKMLFCWHFVLFGLFGQKID